ncbi:hypothetical protein CRYUN_Cryun30bG0076700 [Craigia yunnanensis]
MANQGEEAVWGKKEDLESGEEVSRPSWFQKKKGSVFPVKKKIVKTIMVDCIAKSLSSLCISPDASLSSKVGRSLSTTPSKSPKGKKSVQICPDP